MADFKGKKDKDIKVVARNKQAFHDFEIIDRYEAGISLLGTEIKSVRNGGLSLKQGYVRVKDGEVWLVDTRIAPYSHSSVAMSHEPFRPRRLLLHRREIDSIMGKVQRKGLTILPLSAYIKNNRAKLEIGLARSKREYDKKQVIIGRELDRAAQREIKSSMKVKKS